MTMKKCLLLCFFFGLASNFHAQNVVIVRDSIMNVYMESGYADKHFMPEGETDSSKLRQGKWKDYEVSKDFMIVTTEGIPTQHFGYYLLYGEGEFKNGKREGSWKFYVLEDKTFLKILQKEVFYVRGSQEGKFMYFFPDGKLGVEGTYAADQIQGTLNSYFENGKLFSKRQYEKGIRTGKHVFLYPDGKTHQIAGYVNDTLHGTYESYYENGNKQEFFNLSMGKEDGIYRYYHENGQLWIEKVYKKGLLINVTGNYDAQGKSRDKGTLKNGNGTVHYYTAEGKIYSTLTYKNGQEVAGKQKKK